METTASKKTTFTGNADDYTHNFNERIGEQTGNVNAQYEQYAADRAESQAQRQAYQDAFANQSAYNDLLDAAESKYGVGDRRNNYEQSMRAIAATNQAMNALPSTINANSERVLTQAQKNAALGNQMMKYQNTLSSWQGQNATDAAMYQAVLNEARNLAGQNMAQEQYKLGMQQSDWQTLLNQAAQTYNQAINEQQIRNAIYEQMYQDEQAHKQLEYNYWAKQLDDENAKRQLAVQEAANAAQRSYYDYLMSQPTSTTNDVDLSAILGGQAESTADTNANQYYGSNSYWSDVVNGLQYLIPGYGQAKLVYDLGNNNLGNWGFGLTGNYRVKL